MRPRRATLLTRLARLPLYWRREFLRLRAHHAWLPAALWSLRAARKQLESAYE